MATRSSLPSAPSPATVRLRDDRNVVTDAHRPARDSGHHERRPAAVPPHADRLAGRVARAVGDVDARSAEPRRQRGALVWSESDLAVLARAARLATSGLVRTPCTLGYGGPSRRGVR